jgi:predicted CopG family antitoxin
MSKTNNKGKMREYKNILLTKENYDKLKKLGNTGDSFNVVVTRLLNRNKMLQPGNRIGTSNQIVTE